MGTHHPRLDGRFLRYGLLVRRAGSWGAQSVCGLASGASSNRTAARAADEERLSAADNRLVTPLPLVRNLRLHKDSCPGTNKSQFFFCNSGLMIATELLDCAMVSYWVVGHAKFGPDLVARQIAWLYNTEDAFNHRQLVATISPYATAGTYDGSLLHM